MRPIRWIVVGLLVVACASGGDPPTDASPPATSSTSSPRVSMAPSTTSSHTASTDEWTAAAEVLCPVLWEHAKSIGEAFNDAARDVGSIDDPDGRRDRWRAALDEMRQLDGTLRDRLPETPLLEPIVADVEEGLERSLAEIESLQDLIDETPEVDEGPHQQRTAQLIVRVEKVIDTVKPDMSEFDDGALIEAWRAVPSCQHAVKDVDDGTPRANG